MKVTRFTIYLALIFLLRIPGFTQDISLNFQIFNQEKLQLLYLSDMDLLQQGAAGTSEPIFEIILKAGDPIEFPTITRYTDCSIFLNIKKDGESLVSWQSNTFEIPARSTPYYLSNIPLIANNYRFDESDPNTQVVLNKTSMSGNIESLQEDIFSSGKLPVGNYTLEVLLNYKYIYDNKATNGRTEEYFTFIEAVNPSFIQLISPGNQVTDGDPLTIYNEFPVFQWTGNGDEYQVVVFEKRNHLQSIDDIVRSRENWKSELSPVQSVIYPQGGKAIPLETGKTYYWMVRMFVSTSSGKEAINSEIWQFYLANPASQANGQGIISKNDMLAFLRDLLGDKADEIAESLDDYQVSGIKVNGTEITIQELYNLINTYRSQKVEVMDLILPETIN